jgi:hypothetical protein
MCLQNDHFIGAGIELLCLSSGRSSPGRIKCSFQLTFELLPHILISASGRSWFLEDQNLIATTNLFDGVDYYDLTNKSLVDSMRMSIKDNIITPIRSSDRVFCLLVEALGPYTFCEPSLPLSLKHYS